MSQLNEGCRRSENNLLQADCLTNFGANKGLEKEKRREEKSREEKRDLLQGVGLAESGPNKRLKLLAKATPPKKKD